MCRAYSIDETVVLGGSENVDPLKDPTAAKVLAAALREAAVDDQAQSVRLLERARETREIAAMLESKAAGMEIFSSTPDHDEAFALVFEEGREARRTAPKTGVRDVDCPYQSSDRRSVAWSDGYEAESIVIETES